MQVCHQSNTSCALKTGPSLQTVTADFRVAGAAPGRHLDRRPSSFKAGQAGHARVGAELGHAAHHDHGAAGQHNVIVAHVQQVGDQAVVSLLAGVGWA